VGQRLDGRVVVVTGANRRDGIGFAIVRRLREEGASVFAHGYGSESGDPDVEIEVDLGEPDGPAQVIEGAFARFGAVDALVVNHACSSGQSLETVTAEELDRAWAVNGRAAILLAQAFAAHHDEARGNGRIVFFTSGQHLGPMPGELPYVASKGAVHQMTRTLADELAGRGINVNAINPGPVDTGWAAGDLHERVRSAFPAGRWGRPEDIAPVVTWLVSTEAGWITGQVIDAEGGFRR